MERKITKAEKDLLVKTMEGYRIYFKEMWRLFLESGGRPITHNTFYDFMKEKISKDLTELTGADIREKQNENN